MQGVPKFSSFQPKPKAKPTSEASATTAPTKPVRSRHRENDNDERLRRRSESRGNLKKPSQYASENIRSNPSDVFVIDRKGDREIQNYGANNKSLVPTYWPPSKTRLLGDHDSRENFPKRSLLSSLGRSERSELKKGGVYVRYNLVPDLHPDERGSGFISIRPRRKRKRSETGTANEISKYQPRAERALPEETSNEDDTSSTDEQSEAESNEETTRLKAENARFASNLKSDPGNAQTWLEYIVFQDVWKNCGAVFDEEATTDAELQGAADVKLSIYLKALDNIPISHPAREQLVIGMLRDAELVVEHVKMLEKWRQSVDSNKQYHSLGIEYINFVQSKFASFNFKTCQDLYIGQLQRCSRENCAPGILIHLFLRLTRFLSDGCYQELAIALWQAVLELHCFTPADLYGRGYVPPEFAEFWDRERPRIGEVHARGWHVPPDTTTTDLVFNTETGQHTTLSEPDRFSRWHKAETRSMNELTMPGRTMDDEVDDPYHAVLFSDIEPLIPHIRLVAAHPIDLVNAFLSFNKLPLLPETRTDKLIAISSIDSFLLSMPHGEDMGLLPTFTAQNESDDPVGFGCFGDLIQKGVSTIDALFSTKHFTKASISLRIESVSQRTFVGNVLQTLAGRYPEWTSLGQYYVAFEYQNTSPEVAKKHVKRLLKQNSSSLPLYNVYALIEARMGNTPASDKVFQTAISMSEGLGATARQDVLILWHRWIWLAIEAGLYTVAAQRFCSFGGFEIGPSYFHEHAVMEEDRLSVIDHHLLTHLTTALSSSNTFNALRAIDLMALRRYALSSAFTPSLDAALSYYRTTFANLPTSLTADSLALEHLHQHRARLISHHIHASLPYRPRDIRAVLEESIALFPANTKFLALHRENEQRNRIDDRVREHARELLHVSRAPSLANTELSNNHNALPMFLGGSITHPNPADNIITHFFTIMAEIKRGTLLGSTQYSVRAAFERAAAARTCRNSPALWTAWVAYECTLLPSAGSEKLSRSIPKSHKKQEALTKRQEDVIREQKRRIQQVFFRGLNNLPWVKGYAMLALGPLRERGVMGDEECRAVYDGMVEKGLRVVHELEE